MNPPPDSGLCGVDDCRHKYEFHVQSWYFGGYLCHFHAQKLHHATLLEGERDVVWVHVPSTRGWWNFI